FNLVDLGAGDGQKTMILLEEARRMKADFRFVPIDISEGAMRGLVTNIAAKLPDVPVQGLVAEYTAGVRWLAQHSQGRSNLILFLGSNIGNFNRANARGFLSRLWSAMHINDRILIGFDLKKDIDRLLSAYNDSQGVTAEFNLNLIDRLNRELDADFDRTRWRHYGTYNVFSGAMESYLVSMEHQTVHIDRLERLFTFEAWEPIHTEYSYKYLTSDIDSLASDSGFRMENRFLDERGWFSDDLWCPIKKPVEPSF
ncbi:MAG: L-histidine N(alpha)-methyltransferase, partial [Myxococcota bacterium]